MAESFGMMATAPIIEPPKVPTLAELVRVAAANPVSRIAPEDYSHDSPDNAAPVSYADWHSAVAGIPADADWSKMNQPSGELKPASYTPSQRVGNAAQDAFMAMGANPGVASHLASGLGGVLGATPVGLPVTAADAIYANATGDKVGAAESMAGMIPGLRPEAKAAGKAIKAINWDRSTVSHGNLPIYGDKQVIDVPVANLERAFKATDPRAHSDVIKPKQEVADYAASGKPMSLPEVDATNGRIGFTNGRNRFAVARDNGEAIIPVATETPDELRALLVKHGGHDGN
jgi:hypothetical protein